VEVLPLLTTTLVFSLKKGSLAMFLYAPLSARCVTVSQWQLATCATMRSSASLLALPLRLHDHDVFHVGRSVDCIMGMCEIFLISYARMRFGH